MNGSEKFSHQLRAIDGGGAHQYWPAFGVLFLHFFHSCLEFGPLASIYEIRLIVADHRQMGGNHYYIELVNGVEFLSLRVSGSRHARQLLVETEVVLERDRRVGDALPQYLTPPWPHRLMETVRPPAALHQPASEVVNNDYLAIFDHVVSIPLVKDMCLECGIQKARKTEVLGVVEVLDIEQLFYLQRSAIRKDTDLSLISIT